MPGDFILGSAGQFQTVADLDFYQRYAVKNVQKVAIARN
jgi:hypothetical protein